MSKVNRCIVLATQDDLPSLQRWFLSDPSSIGINANVVEGGLEFNTFSKDYESKGSYDLVVAEDDWAFASGIVLAAARSGSITSVLVVTSPGILKELLESRMAQPKLLTLDFVLERKATRGEEIELTRKLYEMVKVMWKDAYVVGLTAFEIDTEGKPISESADLVKQMRINGDSVYQKDSPTNIMLSHIFRNGYDIAQLREEVRKTKEKNFSLKSVLGMFHTPSIEELPPKLDFEGIIGTSIPIRYIYWYVLKYAATKDTITLEGESGVGKEVIARAIHHCGPRRNSPFVSVNMATHSTDLFGSELFGHERGAFTGAIQSKQGKFELADKGTLFLDEIGEMDQKLQVMLNQVIEGKNDIWRVGGTSPLSLDIRIITATNKDLQTLVKRGKFREDLYYRIHGMFPKIPALRDRPEDILPLAMYFIRRECKSRNIKEKHLTGFGIELLNAHAWPGNVRELENLIKNALTLSDSETIGDELLNDMIQSSVVSVSPDQPFTGELMGKTFDALKKIDAAAKQTEANGEELTHENVARRMGITGQRISQIFNELRTPMISIVESNPWNWLTAQKLKGFPRRLHRR